MQAASRQPDPTAAAFQASIDASFQLEFLPYWTRALSAVWLLLAAHRRGVGTDVLWPRVQEAAVALWDMEQRGMNVCGGSGMVNDPKRGPFGYALIRLAEVCGQHSYTRQLSDYIAEQLRESARRELLAAAEVFPWSELPESRMVVAMLNLCGRMIGV